MQKKWMFVCLCVCMMTLTACGPNWSEIPEGTYSFQTGIGFQEAQTTAWSKVMLKVDRTKKTVTVTLPDGKTQDVSYTSAPRDKWIQHCPMNFTSSWIEYLELKGPLTIGDITYQEPALVGDCNISGASSRIVQLIEKSDMLGNPNYSGPNCRKEGNCVTFTDTPQCNPAEGPCS